MHKLEFLIFVFLCLSLWPCGREFFFVSAVSCGTLQKTGSAAIEYYFTEKKILTCSSTDPAFTQNVNTTSNTAVLFENLKASTEYTFTCTEDTEEESAYTCDFDFTTDSAIIVTTSQDSLDAWNSTASNCQFASDTGKCSLRQAVDYVRYLGKIGTPVVHPINITRSSTIQNQSIVLDGDGIEYFIKNYGENEILIDSNGQVNTIFDISGGTTVSISDVTIRGNSSCQGIYSVDSSLTLTNVIIDSCTSNSSGGGIYFDCISNTCPLTITNILMQNNNAVNEYGGALYVKGAGVYLDIDYAIFKENSASAGGAVYVNLENSNDAFFGSVDFFENTANLKGGAIYIDGVETLEFLSLKALSNRISNVDGDGGAMYVQECQDFTILDGIFTNNSATRNGGAVYFEEKLQYLSIGRANFTRNVAKNGDGGALYLKELDSAKGTRLFEHVSFENNAAFDGKGGALYLNKCSSLSTEQVLYLGQSSENALILQSLNISNNNASGAAAGLYIGSNCLMQIENSMIQGNIVHESSPPVNSGGAGLYFLNATATGLNVVMKNNLVPSKGASLWLNEANFTCSECLFYENTVKSEVGEGVSAYGEGDSYIRIFDTVVLHELRSKESGSLFAGDSNLYLKNVNITNDIILDAYINVTGTEVISDYTRLFNSSGNNVGTGKYWASVKNAQIMVRNSDIDCNNFEFGNMNDPNSCINAKEVVECGMTVDWFSPVCGERASCTDYTAESKRSGFLCTCKQTFFGDPLTENCAFNAILYTIPNEITISSDKPEINKGIIYFLNGGAEASLYWNIHEEVVNFNNYNYSQNTGGSGTTEDPSDLQFGTTSGTLSIVNTSQVVVNQTTGEYTLKGIQTIDQSIYNYSYNYGDSTLAALYPNSTLLHPQELKRCDITGVEFNFTTDEMTARSGHYKLNYTVQSSLSSNAADIDQIINFDRLIVNLEVYGYPNDTYSYIDLTILEDDHAAGEDFLITIYPKDSENRYIYAIANDVLDSNAVTVDILPEYNVNASHWESCDVTPKEAETDSDGNSIPARFEASCKLSQAYGAGIVEVRAQVNNQPIQNSPAFIELLCPTDDNYIYFDGYCVCQLGYYFQANADGGNNNGGLTGQCEACQAGEYKDFYTTKQADDLCKACDTTYLRQGITQDDHSTSKDQCICRQQFYKEINPNYGNNDDAEYRCTPCVEGMICDQMGLSLETVVIEENYWRTNNASKVVQACPDLHCTGSCFNQDGEPIEGRSPDCPETFEGLTSASQYCETGYTGAYCMVCAPGYSENAAGNCALCSGGSAFVTPILAGIGLSMIIVAVLYISIKSSRSASRKNQTVKKRVSMRYSAVDNKIISTSVNSYSNWEIWRAIVTKLKILLVFSQIVVNLPDIINVKYPPGFLYLIDKLSFFNFNFIEIFSIGCLVKTNFYTSLLLYTLGPIIISSVCYLGGLLYEQTIRDDDPNRDELRLATRSWSVSAVLTITYLCFAAVSSRIFQTFNCETFDGEYGSYLRSDYSVSCTTDNHKSYQLFAGAMCAIYPIGVPVTYFMLLAVNRTRVYPSQYKDEEKQIKVRSEDQAIKKYDFLYRQYVPRCWWFETFESFRRLMLSGVLVLCLPGSVDQIFIGLLVSLVSVKVYMHFQPFVDTFDNRFAEFAQTVICVTFLMAFLEKLNAADDSSFPETEFQGVVTFLNVSVVICGILLVLLEFRKQRIFASFFDKVDARFREWEANLSPRQAKIWAWLKKRFSKRPIVVPPKKKRIGKLVVAEDMSTGYTGTVIANPTLDEDGESVGSDDSSDSDGSREKPPPPMINLSEIGLDEADIDIDYDDVEYEDNFYDVDEPKNKERRDNGGFLSNWKVPLSPGAKQKKRQNEPIEIELSSGKPKVSKTNDNQDFDEDEDRPIKMSINPLSPGGLTFNSNRLKNVWQGNKSKNTSRDSTTDGFELSSTTKVHQSNTNQSKQSNINQIPEDEEDVEYDEYGNIVYYTEDGDPYYYDESGNAFYYDDNDEVVFFDVDTGEIIVLEEKKDDERKGKTRRTDTNLSEDHDTML